MTEIHILADNKRHPIKGQLKTYFEHKGFKLSNYDPEKAPIVKYLLILEPFTLNDHYYFIHNVWEKYLIKTYPEQLDNIHVISVGLRACQACNYLPLDDMPLDFNKSFLQYVLPLSKITCEAHNDNISNSKDIMDILNKLFKGHGEHNFIGTLNYLIMSTDIIDNSLYDTKEFDKAMKNIYPIAKNQWHIFLHRWKNYQHYLKVCPFPLDNVPLLIEELDLFFALEKPSLTDYQNAHCTEKVKKIRQQFLEIKAYVKPEFATENIAN